jgi:ribosomal protein S18 acetylase RimI-like enzyme
MTDIEKRLRPARIDEADVLAELVDYAGEGLPSYLWGKMAGPGETAQEVGRRRAARETGTFSYRNATMIEYAGHAAGSLISYVIPDAPAPVPSDVPAMLVPLQELENRAPGTWNVNVLGVLPQFRSLGLGTELLRMADESARKLGRRGMSIIVSDANIGARRLYERLGYREVARRTMVKEQWVSDGHEWVLLIKLF